MVYWNMLKKLQGHKALADGEHPVAAVYGLGEPMLRAADGAAEGLSGGPSSSGTIDGPTRYVDELEAATEGRHREGHAALIVGNGVLGLTSRRLLWFRKATVVGRPGDPTAEFSHDDLVEAERMGSVIRIVFNDRSVAGLHVPRSQKPQIFVDEVMRLMPSVG